MPLGGAPDGLAHQRNEARPPLPLASEKAKQTAGPKESDAQAVERALSAKTREDFIAALQRPGAFTAFADTGTDVYWHWKKLPQGSRRQDVSSSWADYN